jgi:dTDP-6-deoxy-L-talose 4-dehydrogenase (NAD+)
MKILVTGARGFIGRAFCAEALARGSELLCLTRRSGGDATTNPPAMPHVHGDLGSLPWREIERFAPDALLHLAWIATPGQYLDSPLNERLTDQSIELMSGLEARGVTNLVAAGTCIEYAASHQPVSESSSRIAPDAPYAVAKNRLHEWMRQREWSPGVGWSWLRIFHPYGPGEHPDRLATSFAKRFAAGERVVLRTPSSVKDFIYITDLARAICDVLESRLGGAINLGTGRGTSIRKLAETVAEVLAAPKELIQDADESAVDARPFIVADITRLSSTGWRPRVDLPRGVSQLVGSLDLASR